MYKLLFVAAGAALLSACGGAQEPGEEHAGMDHSGHMQTAGDAVLSPAQQAYAAVNVRMHEGMADIPEDADEAFMRGMLAHHRGAVEMSQVALEYGADEESRALAQRIIDAQQAEIAEIEAWLNARGANLASAGS